MTLKLIATHEKPILDRFIVDFEKNCEDLCAVVSLCEAKNDLWTIELYFDEGLDAKDITARIKPFQEDIAFAFEALPEKDWVAESQRNLKPIIAGSFFVHGSHDHPPAHSHAIKIDAATAFGTGHHGTTRGCLIALDFLAKHMTPKRILDLGCGSAILAIACAKKFKTTILASDIDQQAVRVAQDNVKDNGVQNFVRTLTAKGFNNRLITKKAPYDMVLANILPKPLCAMAQDMRAHTHQGSVLILSGILDKQARMVEALYRTRDFTLAKRIILGEWHTLILFRK